MEGAMFDEGGWDGTINGRDGTIDGRESTAKCENGKKSYNFLRALTDVLANDQIVQMPLFPVKRTKAGRGGGRR